MTNHDAVEEYLGTIGKHLDLPAERAAQVVTELRTHLLADIAERVANGRDESTAAREAVAEMGDARKAALALTRENRPGASVLRAILAVQLMRWGIDGAWGATAAGLSPNYLADRGFGKFVYTAGHPLLILTSGLSMMVVGYVLRRRGWLLGVLYSGIVIGAPLAYWHLMPIGAMSVSGPHGTWHAVNMLDVMMSVQTPAGMLITKFPQGSTCARAILDVATLLALVVGGGYLGSRLYQSSWRGRRATLIIALAVLAPLEIFGHVCNALVSDTSLAASVIAVAKWVLVLGVVTLAVVATSQFVHDRTTRRVA